MERTTQDFAPSEQLLKIAEEFVDRVRNRESPTVDEYVEQYPEIKDEIRRYLPMLLPSSSAQSVTDSFGHDQPISPDMLPVGVSRYHVRTLIGSGNMGAVYQARDLELDRIVGLKIPQLDHRHSVERFYREARAMATVEHRNICSVFDVGQFEPDDIDGEELSGLVGRPFLTMAFIHGTELSKQMDGPWDQVDAAKLVAKIADALQVIHDAGVVHRDVKPGNIIMDLQNEPVITDFGLARRDLPEEVELTVDGQIIGSPAYMSPEQINGRPELGPQADVYSLGVMFYEMVCGKRPFTGSPLTLLRDICWKEATNPRQIREDIDTDLESICLRAIEKDPVDRYQSAADFAADLNAYLDGRYVPPPPKRRRKPNAWLPWLAGVAAMLLGVVLLSKSGLLSNSKSNSPEEQEPVSVIIAQELKPKVSREEFERQLREAFFDHFQYISTAGREPNISEKYRRVFERYGIRPESTSAEALKIFMGQQPQSVQTDILIGLESWLLCKSRNGEDVPVPWLRTQLEANNPHYSPLRTALIELDADKVKVQTREFALKHFDPRLSVVSCLHMRKQDPESAMWLAQEANTAFPDNAAILATIGLLRSDLNHRRPACEAFSAAAKIEPLPQFYTRISQCKLANNMTQQAQKAAKKAIELDATDGTAYFALGKALFRAGETDAAAKQLDLAIKSDCCFLPFAHGFLARCLIRQGKIEPAMEHARIALGMFRENESWFNLTRLAQDLLIEFETIDEHAYQTERFEVAGEFLRNAKKQQQFRRLRPYVVRLRNDIIASDSEDAPKQIEAIKRWLPLIDRLKRTGRK